MNVWKGIPRWYNVKGPTVGLDAYRYEGPWGDRESAERDAKSLRSWGDKPLYRIKVTLK